MAATIAPPAQHPPHSSSDADAARPRRTVTILLTTFAGLNLPRTLSLPIPESTSIHDALQLIHSRLPSGTERLIVTTTSNRQLLSANDLPVSTLLSSHSDTFLPLRLSARLCGGKGGFGSQLRAAGGRMSSRKKRDQNQNTNGSNRNLDGRRLRVVDQVRRMADELARSQGKVEKEAKEKQEGLRKAVEDLERKEELIRSGKFGGDKGRLDAEFVEGKGEAERRTREDVVRGLMEGTMRAEMLSGRVVEASRSGSARDAGALSGPSYETVMKEDEDDQPQRSYFGFDEDDDSDSEEGDEEEDQDTTPEVEEAIIGKGKGKIS